MRNAILKRSLALLLTLVMLVGMTPTVVMASALTLTQDGDDYYVNMNSSGSDTLDLTDKENGFTFTVYDDGGSGGSYSNSSDNTLLITAPGGFTLKIEGPVATESGYDRLYIYDGDTTVPVGADDYNGSITIGAMYTSSNVLKLCFTSDSSVNDPGFALNVTLIDMSTMATVAYSYTGNTRQVFYATGTQITLPDFADMFTAPNGSTFVGWISGGTLYAEGDPFIVTGDVTFAASVEEPQVVFGNDTDGWYANMPATGTVNADLTDRSSGFTFHVYDNGGASANYSNNCRGYMIIVAPADCILRISGSGVTESGYDGLKKYDGDNTTNLGDERYTGAFSFEPMYTTGNVLKLLFYSDNSDTRSGIDLTLTVASLSGFAFLSFDAGEGSGTMDDVRLIPGERYTVPDCTFTLPENKLFSHWTDGTNDYAPGDEITVSGNMTLTAVYNVKATVTYVYGESTQTVDVADGSSISLATFASLFTLPERKVFDGWRCGETLYAEGDPFTVTGAATFTAVLEDEPVVLHGEAGTSYANYANYALFPKSTSVTADLTSADPGYLLWVFDNGGVNGNYANNCDGSITVLAPEGCILQISSDVNTEGSCDFLYVYDGDSTSVTSLGSFSGTNGTGKLYSTGNAVTVRFTSDGGVNRRGIDMKITVTTPSSLVTVSFDPGAGSGTMDDIVLLPGDQTYIPYNAFTVPDGYLFNYYTDGTNTYKEHDLITVNSDLHLTAIFIEKITITYQFGEETYSNTYKKGAQYSVRSFNAVGFTLPYRKSFRCWLNGDTEVTAQTYLYANENVTYTAVLDDLPYLIEDGNGGYYATVPKDEHVTLDLTDKQNGFSFTLYDNGGTDNYSNDCDGSMTITAPDGCVLMFSGNVKTESNDADYLIIYDSDLTTMLGDGAYSVSSDTDIGELFSTGTTAKVYFHSNDYYYAYGFVLTVTLLDPSTLITVSFDAGEGTGTMDTITLISGEAFTLPDYAFTAPEGKIFNGYSDGTNVYWPGTVTFDESKALTALWAAATGITYSCGGEDKAIRYAIGSTVTLPALADLFTPPDGLQFVGWEEKFSGDLYQPGDEFVLNSATVFTAVLEFLLPDGNGGWYANMPTNNPNDEITLDLSDKQSGFSFTLYDGGGADANYGDYNDGVLIVKAPENMVVMVSGGGVTENSYDYLRFRDGASGTSLIIGESKYCGSFIIDEDDPLMSTGNYLMIYFHSDSSYNYAGFELTVTVLAQSQITYVFDGNTQDVAVQKDTTVRLKYFDDLFTSYTEEFLYWQIGDDTYDEGDEYFVNGDVTVTAVTQPMPTVTIDGNGATVTAALGGNGTLTVLGPIPFPTGSTDILPHANGIFDFPAGKYFGGWDHNGQTINVGDEFTITEDVTFTAIWRDASAWDLLGEQLNAASGADLGTISLTADVTAAIGSTPLVIPAGVTATIDLCGFALDGAEAALLDGDAIKVYGDLTLVDSGANGNGAFTGGGVTAFESGAFTPDASVAECFAATVTLGYKAEDENNNNGDYVYCVSWYPTLAAALSAASVSPNYADTLTLAQGMTFRWYLVPDVTLLQDITVAEGETLTVNTDEGIDLDLNGHTFDVRGTFTGGTPGWRYEDGNYIQVVYPTDISIDSTTPGVFRSSGTIGVNLSPWTEDTYYFTGGTVTGFIGADGGTFCISGGRFTGNVMFNNGNENASLEVTLSGDAEFALLEHYIYSDPDCSAIHLTISENVRITDMEFDIMGNDTVTYPVLTVSGGYFTFDPSAMLDEANGDTNVVQIASEPEQYVDQTDWTADETVYTWRVIGIGDLDQTCTVSMGAAADSAKTRADLYFTIPDGADPADFTVTIGGVTTALDTVTPTADGYKFSITVPAKNMGDKIAYSLCYKGATVKSGAVSVADYAENLAALHPEYADFSAAMLAYGAAAQTFFGYDTAHLVSDADLTAIPAVSGDRFDKDAIQSAMIANDAIPVHYSAMNVTFLADTTLSIALRIKPGFTDDEALAWVNANVTLGGEAVAATASTNGDYRFVIITKQNISLDAICEDMELVVNGAGTYSVSVQSYLAAAEESGSDNLKYLTRALYAYSQAAKALNG